MEFRTFQEQIEDGLIRERVMAGLSGFFGVLAALLASIGLYGVIADVVAGRRKEIGIRMPLGASRGQVMGLILKEAATLVAIGLGIGVAGLLALGRTAASLLFGLEHYDPATLVLAAGLLAAVALLGSYFPARRASRFDPIAALRYD
jgi:ABC-type antimicrobial peptide transport system permease subunit